MAEKGVRKSQDKKTGLPESREISPGWQMVLTWVKTFPFRLKPCPSRWEDFHPGRNRFTQIYGNIFTQVETFSLWWKPKKKLQKL